MKRSARVKASHVARFIEQGHLMPVAKASGLSTRGKEAWPCTRCGVVLWVWTDGSGAQLSEEVGCRGR